MDSKCQDAAYWTSMMQQTHPNLVSPSKRVETKNKNVEATRKYIYSGNHIHRNWSILVNFYQNKTCRNLSVGNKHFPEIRRKLLTKNIVENSLEKILDNSSKIYELMWDQKIPTNFWWMFLTSEVGQKLVWNLSVLFRPRFLLEVLVGI